MRFAYRRGKTYRLGCAVAARESRFHTSIGADCSDPSEKGSIGRGPMVTGMVATRLSLALRRAARLVLLAAGLVIGCSSSPDLPPLANGSVTRLNPAADGTTSPQSCADGDQRACSKTLSQHGSVLSCYYGTEKCVGGIWSDCGQGNVVLQSAPPKGDRLATSISSSQPCGAENPCDPSCQKYLEQPSAGLIAQFNPNAGWLSGALSSFPPAIQALVSKPNCETAADCQQNQHCVNVATDSTCTHYKCQTGTALTSTCVDPCVASICSQYPSCCQSNGQLSCKPDELPSPDGTECYYYESRMLAWNNARSSCQARGSGWDLLCIGTDTEQGFINDNGNYYAAWMGLQRITFGDSSSAFKCSNGEQTLGTGQPPGIPPWNSSPAEPNNYGGNENCGEIYGGSGAWNDQSCAVQNPSWCEERPSTTVGWSQDCVSAVSVSCGATCDTSGNNQSAACQAWAPGQLNAQDNAFDLSLGVPCQGQIPVCNHGTTTAPAGIVVHVLPTNPLQLGNPAPSLLGELGSCTTNAVISRGACIMVSGCANYLNGNAQLWVTAPGGGEARIDDNWGYNVPNVTCNAPQCSGAAGVGPCLSSKTQSYDYQGLCPNSGQVPQWSFLTYNSTTPGDSSIAFSVIAAPSVDQLANEPAVPLVTVTHAAGNETCGLDGPASKNCPIDLYTALLPRANTDSAVMRLIITLNPSSDGTLSPVLGNWRISYSCPAGT